MKVRNQIFFLILVFLGVWFAYSKHFNNQFHFDDDHTIVHNQYIRSIKNIPLFFTDAATTSTLPANQAYRPGLTLLNTLDVYFSGKSIPEPFQFHVSIFISFLISGLLLYFILIKLLQRGLVNTFNHVISLFVTAWFLLHTANAETINYVIARSDSFSTLTILASFFLYLYYPALRKWHIYFIPAALGFFVKEQTLMFIPILGVYRLLFEEEVALNKLWEKRDKVFKVILFTLIPLLIGAGLFLFSRKMTPNTWTSGGFDSAKYLLTQPFVIFHYFYNFIVPVNLVVDTDWTTVNSYFEDTVLAGLLFLSVLIYVAIKASQKAESRLVAFGICWFLLGLLPTSIIPFAEVLNDHRTFFPYIGLFIAFASLLHGLLVSEWFSRGFYKKYVCLSLALIFLVLHGYGTYKRSEVWRTEESLWKEATLKAPKNGRGWMNYGNVLLSKADFEGAENCFLKAKELWPNYAYVYVNLGVVKSVKGRRDEAEADFKQALILGPGVPEAYHFYAFYLRRWGRVADAKEIIQKGLQISPMHELLNAQKAELENAQQTVPSINPVETAKQTPTAENYLNASLEYYNKGKYDSCIVAAEQALKLKPGYDLAYNNICAAYNRLKNWDKAIEAGEMGMKLNPSNQLIQGNLNESYREKAHK